MVKEYIEREAVIANRREYNLGGSYDNTELAVPVSAINSIPAADVRPVVLCRDCECWNDWDSVGKESLGNYVCSCALWSVEDGPVFYTSPDDFCSYGEKREGN